MPATLSTPRPVSIAPRRHVVRRVASKLYWPVILGLIALNTWWWWDSRPIPNLRAVEYWLATPKEAAQRAVPWWDIWDVPRDNSGAISVLRRTVRKSPNDAEARLMLGRALGASGDTLGCIEQLRAVPKWSPLKPKALFGEGMALLERKRAREAETAFLAYVAPDPNHPRLARGDRVVIENKLWDIYALEDRWVDARKVAWQAYKDAERQPGVQLRILEVILRTRIERSNPTAAVTSLKPIVEADPQDWEARRAMARALDAIKQYEEADQQLAICLKERPNSPRAWADKLDMLEGREDFAGLALAEKQVPREAETDGRIWMVRGRQRIQVKDFAGAAVAFQKALDLMPDEFSAYYALAQSLQMIGKTKEAELLRKRHVELEAMTKEVPQRVNYYRDVTDASKPELAEIKDAISKLAAACKGMGWKDEAEAWAKTARAL